MKPKISVIVPIYNTEKYLEKCLSSIVNQTLQDIEIICVDDCSPDNSCSIVEKFIKQDSRISLIRHKHNKGSGGARNTGIIVAKADFIAGVDSDDWIKPEMMQTLWDSSEKGKIDIVCCGYDSLDENTGKNTYYSPRPEFIRSPKSRNFLFITDAMFWNKLWRKTLLIDNEIYFPEKLYYQDLATTPRVIATSKSIRVIENRLYHYLVRPEAVTTTYSDKHITDTFKVLSLLKIKFLEENCLREKEFTELIDVTVYEHSKRVLRSSMNEKEINQYLERMLNARNEFLGVDLPLRNMTQKQLLFALRNKSLTLRVLEVFYWLFVTPKQHIKLKNNPRSFFQHSNSIFTQKIGSFLGYGR